MAKKNTSESSSSGASKGSSFSKISSLIKDMGKTTGIILQDKKSEDSCISTGVYALNALCARSILKGGIPKDRITILAGPPQCGKTYICLNVARNAQKMGFKIIYIDTEHSVSFRQLEEFGVDTSEDKLILVASNKVEDLKMGLAQILDELKKDKKEGKKIEDTLIILDSIGQLASDKEVSDAVEGKNKADMSRAKAIKSLFRIINSDLGHLQIPMLCTGHIYMSQDFFPVAKLAGGEGPMYSASLVIFMSTAKLKTGQEDDDHKAYMKDIGQSGVIVTAKSQKNRMAKPMTIKMEIDFKSGTNPYKGLEVYCTPENFEKVGVASVKVEKDKKGNIIKVEKGDGKKFYVRHLDKTLFERQLFNSTVFTKEVLEALDPIIAEDCKYSSYEEQEKIMQALNAQGPDLDEDADDFDIDKNNDQLFN